MQVVINKTRLGLTIALAVNIRVAHSDLTNVTDTQPTIKYVS